MLIPDKQMALALCGLQCSLAMLLKRDVAFPVACSFLVMEYLIEAEHEEVRDLMSSMEDRYLESYGAVSLEDENGSVATIGFRSMLSPLDVWKLSFKTHSNPAGPCFKLTHHLEDRTDGTQTTSAGVQAQ